MNLYVWYDYDDIDNRYSEFGVAVAPTLEEARELVKAACRTEYEKVRHLHVYDQLNHLLSHFDNKPDVCLPVGSAGTSFYLLG